jgi:hypothetical protein
MAFLKLLKNAKFWRNVIRIFGRALDDINPGMFELVGLTITVAPGIFINLRAKSALTRTAATFLIDVSAFLLGDVIGEAAGAGAGMVVPLAETALLGVVLGADIGSSVAWDGYADKKDWDAKLEQKLKSFLPRRKDSP